MTRAGPPPIVVATLLALAPPAAGAPRTSAAQSARAPDGIRDVRGLARALADSLRGDNVCVVRANTNGVRVPLSADPLSAALARALTRARASRGGAPACRDSSYYVEVDVERVLSDGRAILVDIGLVLEGKPDVPGSGVGRGWTYRVVRRGDRWRVVGRVGRRWST